MDGVGGRLAGSEIHGFNTFQDLDIQTMLEEAYSRWLRPNEIHAVLCNHKHFPINVKPVNLPKSGTVLLFDRKMLRNFRKDGHNWKKKKDGKTIKEAHEHLKASFLNVFEFIYTYRGVTFLHPIYVPSYFFVSTVQVGNQERIHVYYAHGDDNPTFVRRCYWLLDKSQEHIVLVHYRETHEAAPATPGNSYSSSITDHLSPKLVSEDIISGHHNACNTVYNNSLLVKNHESKLHEINTLDWDELLVPSDISNQPAPTEDDMLYFAEQLPTAARSSANHENNLACYNTPTNIPSFPGLGEPVHQNENGLQSQESFGRWLNSFISDSPGSVEDPSFESMAIHGQDPSASSVVCNSPSNIPEQVFNITDVSPAWAYSVERTKILVTGFFHDSSQHYGRSNLFCICGESCVTAEYLQVGVYRCFLPPQSPGVVDLYLSADGQKPISQFFSFERRSVPVLEKAAPQDDELYKWEEFEFQVRLAHLLFTSSNKISVLSSKISPVNLQEAKKLANRTSHLLNSWAYLMKSIQANEVSFDQAKDHLFELTLKNRLKEWLLEKVLENRNTKEYDSKGLGVIHLCAILGYTWSIHLFSWAGISLDFRDKHGWTALHWAAYYGREKMVAALLSAGARPNLVTDPNKENLGGCTAADLAQEKGYDGLAAFLAEKSLIAQFKDMKTAGNISGNIEAIKTETLSPETVNEEEQSLKDTLAAYRTAAEAAARIQGAFREHELKVRSSAVKFASKEDEVKNIIAAMKIQNAFRNYEMRRKITAAARIQFRFQTWKMRREFLNMRNKAIKIQAVFRGFQVRRQYRKITWSVGVLEKAILRWRLKRKGFRGLQLRQGEGNEEESSEAVEDFYKTSQKQAEDRLERSVVRVQAMFRSKKAQKDYRRMKLAHQEAQVEYDKLQEREMDMES